MSKIGFAKTRVVGRGLEETALVTSGSISSEVRSSQACKRTINHGTFPATQASTPASHTGETKGTEADSGNQKKERGKEEGRLNPVT